MFQVQGVLQGQKRPMVGDLDLNIVTSRIRGFKFYKNVPGSAVCSCCERVCVCVCLLNRRWRQQFFLQFSNFFPTRIWSMNPDLCPGGCLQDILIISPGLTGFISLYVLLDVTAFTACEFVVVVYFCINTHTPTLHAPFFWAWRSSLDLCHAPTFMQSVTCGF